MRVKNLLAALLIASGVLLFAAVAAGVDADEAQAQTANPSLQDTARLLGYMWGDGSKSGNVWDVNGPSGTSTLIEELIVRHGGTFVDRERLTFTLPAPYNWNEWTNGVPNDSATVRAAVQDPNFLAAVLETEASVGGQIYDQTARFTNGYTIGRLTSLRDLMRSQGFSTTSVERFTSADSGRVFLGASQWDELRRDHEFVCPTANNVIRIPGGTKLGTYGNLRWIGSGSSWGDVVRTDCTTGRAVPTAGQQVGSCTASVSNNRLNISWTHNLGNVVVRVNNNFVDTVSARDGFFSTSTSGNNAVELRIFALGVRTDVNCGTGGGNAGGGATPCSVTASGNQVRLEWNNFGVSEYSVRRNGSWVTTTTSTAATVAGSTGDAWIIRYRTNGNVIDVSCGADDGTPAGPCSITNQANGVLVGWSGVTGVNTYNVRRNGSWVGDATGQSRFVDASGSVNADYQIRYRINGQVFNINC